MIQVWVKGGNQTHLIGFTENFKSFVSSYMEDEGYQNVHILQDGTVTAFRSGIKHTFFSTPLKVGRVIPLLLTK